MSKEIRIAGSMRRNVPTWARATSAVAIVGYAIVILIAVMDSMIETTRVWTQNELLIVMIATVAVGANVAVWILAVADATRPEVGRRKTWLVPLLLLNLVAGLFYAILFWWQDYGADS